MNNTQNVGEALEAYFETYGLGKDGGLDNAWGKLKMGNVYIPFPNPHSRKRALIFHDIHHLATGYKADWEGEASIAAWEIGSGCKDFYAAWVLDLGGMALGIWIYPKQVFKAFVRGLRSRNLYTNRMTQAEAKNLSIAQLREHLELTETGFENPTTNEKLSFAFWWLFSWAFSSVFYLLPLPLLIFLVWHFVF